MRRTMLVHALAQTLLLSSVLLPGTAKADSTAAAAFGGWMVVGPHMCQPAAPGCGGPVKKGPGAALAFVLGAGPNMPDPKGLPSLCLGIAASLKKVPQLIGVTCDLDLAGFAVPDALGLGPWCAHNSGVGAGVLTFGKIKAFDLVFTWEWTGAAMVLAGAAFKPAGQAGPFAATWTVANNSTNSSCLDKIGPDAFRVTGEIAFETLGVK